MSHTYDMITNDRSITEQLPDLPALESAESGVSARMWVMVFFMAYTLFMVAPCVFLYWKARPFFGDQFALATFAVALLALLILWVFVRMLSGVFAWKTDEHGLSMRGLIHRRFVAWQDVEDAVSEQGAGGLYYRLHTGNGIVHVNVESRYDSPALYASIWQHLRRLGRAGNVDLPEAALTFWDRIPDELPAAIGWTNPRPPKLWVTVATILGLVGFLTWAAVVLLPGGNWFVKGIMAITGVGFMFIMWSVLRDSLRTAMSASVTDDHVEVQTVRGAVILPWTEVTRARWPQNGDQVYDGLLITGRNASDRVTIPHILSDEDSGRLILAIIRRLRTAEVPQALSIPEELRAQVGPARIESKASDSIALLNEPAEVRLTIRERMLIMLFPMFVAFSLIFGKGGIRPASIAVPITIGLLALVWFASGTYALHADSDGIRKRFLGLGRLIRWDDIAEYSICPVFKKAIRNHRVVKNSIGKVLMEFGLSFGARKARDRFWAILDSRLTQSWVSAKPAEPWKSRPWTPS